MTATDRLGLRFPQRLTKPLALANVTVVPMDSNRVLARQTVVIEDGVISTVGPSDLVSTGRAKVVDCSNKYLAPGLADMHVHCWELTDIALYLANGVTTVRNMRGAPFHLALRQRVARAEIPGPQMITTTPLIDGVDTRNRTTRPDSLPLGDPDDARPMVSRLAARGYQQVKAYQSLSGRALRALGAASAEAGLRMTGHCPDGVTYEQSIGAGMSCFEHLTGIATGHRKARAPALPDPLNSSRYLRGAFLLARDADLGAIARLADRMAEREIWNCPTVIVNSVTTRSMSSHREDPELRYAPFQLASRWRWLMSRRLGGAGASGCEDARALIQAKTAATLGIVSILHRAGAPLLVGTDARSPFVHPGFAIHDELEHFVEAGLTRYEALRCATADAARFLREDDAWGTVAEGKRADLLVLDGNPLADLQTLRDPQAVLANGFYLQRENLKALLRERERWARQVERLPPVKLAGAPKDDARPAAEGRLTETRFAAPTVTTAYRHRRLADGGYRIEETHAAAPAGTRGWLNLRLAHDLVILDGESVVEGPLGKEACVFGRRSGGGYAVRVTDVDGHTTTTDLEATSLFPSERLSVSFYPVGLGSPEVANRLEAVPVPSLSIDNGEARIIVIAVSRSGDRPAEKHREGVVWRLTVDRPGEPALYLHRFGCRGNLVESTEVGSLSALRVTPS